MSTHAARLARLEQIRGTLGPNYPASSECRDCTYGRSVRAEHYRRYGGTDRHTTKATCRTCSTTTVEMWDGAKLVRENRRKLTKDELRRQRFSHGLKFNGHGHVVGCVCGCEQ